MLAPLIPAPLHHFARMRLVFLDSRIRKHPHIVVHVEVEQGSGLAASLVDDEIVERVVL